MYYLYVHTSPNGKRYIGVTENYLKRWSNGKGYLENERFSKDIEKYGWNAIRHEIIAEFEDRKEAEHYEMLYTILFDSENPAMGYNKTTFKKDLLTIVSNKKDYRDWGKREKNVQPEAKNIFELYGISYDAGDDLINQWILNEKHRMIMKDRLLNDMTATDLSIKYGISVRQIKNIIYECQRKLIKHI